MLALLTLHMVFGLPATSTASGRQSQSLAGRWQFQADPQDKGLAGRWFGKELSQTIRLPGSMPENGYGNDVTVETQWNRADRGRSWFSDEKYEHLPPGRTTSRFALLADPGQTLRRTAWSRRTSDPERWNARDRAVLERCHWNTQVLGRRPVGRLGRQSERAA
jgi:hypothetical protein